jgi:AbrB family looped-hinge helix DNA binding protein
MPSKLSEINKMKVFPKGQVVIPVSLRKKYNIDIGDHVEVIPSSDGILLKPSSKAKGSGFLTDTLFGTFEKYTPKKKNAGKKDIIKATETGFLEGWKE